MKKLFDLAAGDCATFTVCAGKTMWCLKVDFHKKMFLRPTGFKNWQCHSPRISSGSSFLDCSKFVIS
jgi:hypothetical protein